MSQNILYSMSELLPVLQRAFPAKPGFSLAEIGSEAGIMTRELCRLAEQGEIGEYYVIEPCPSEGLLQLAEGSRLQVVPQTSLEALEHLPVCDVYLLDGDHNYYTVERETTLILERARREGKTPLLFYHDVCWPCSRRDAYYAPERIPQASRHEHTHCLGVTPDPEMLSVHGFRATGVLSFATKNGGAKNGVRTAIEDAIRSYPQWELLVVPAIFGLGIALSTQHPEYARIREALAPFVDNPLLARLEENRIRLFLEVQKLEDILDGNQSLGQEAVRPTSLSQGEAAGTYIEQKEWLRETEDHFTDAGPGNRSFAVDFDALLIPTLNDAEVWSETWHRLRAEENLLFPFSEAEFKRLRAAAVDSSQASCDDRPKLLQIYCRMSAVVRDPEGAAITEARVDLSSRFLNQGLYDLIRKSQEIGGSMTLAGGASVHAEAWSLVPAYFPQLEKDGIWAAGPPPQPPVSRGPNPTQGKKRSATALHAGLLAKTCCGDVRNGARSWHGSLSYLGRLETWKEIPALSDPLRAIHRASLAARHGVPPNKRDVNPISPDLAFTLAPTLCRFADWCNELAVAHRTEGFLVLAERGGLLHAMLANVASCRNPALKVVELGSSRRQLALAALESTADGRLVDLLNLARNPSVETLLGLFGITQESVAPELMLALTDADQRKARIALLEALTVGRLRSLVELAITQARASIIRQLNSEELRAGKFLMAALMWNGQAVSDMNRILAIQNESRRISGLFLTPAGTFVSTQPEADFWDHLGGDSPLLAPVWVTPPDGKFPSELDIHLARLVEGICRFQQLWLAAH